MDEMRKRDEIHMFVRGHRAEKLWVFGSCTLPSLVLSCTIYFAHCIYKEAIAI